VPRLLADRLAPNSAERGAISLEVRTSIERGLEVRSLISEPRGDRFVQLSEAPTGVPDKREVSRAPATDIKVAILAGGVGSRIQEETEIKPKPMVEIGGKPILWHIMKIYSSQGFNNFVIALGYKGEVIKRWMVDYSSLQGDLTVSLGSGRVVPHNGNGNGSGNGDSHAFDDWTVDLVDTGQGTETGGRIKRLAPYMGDSTFMLTWGDGVADIDLHRLLEFHRAHGRLATVTAVRPPARFGHLEFDGDLITEFSEKPQLGEGWINGAFFVLEPGVFDYIDGDRQWERQPLERLARDRQLVGYRHESFWQCMDTLRDKKLLEEFWSNGAPWRIWN
jgi:glucose-1-phosphate cytidylyltransferase